MRGVAHVAEDARPSSGDRRAMATAMPMSDATASRART
jgi:hypothetical protein